MATIYVLAKATGDGDSTRVRIHGITDNEAIADTWTVGASVNRTLTLDTEDGASYEAYEPGGQED